MGMGNLQGSTIFQGILLPGSPKQRRQSKPGDEHRPEPKG